MAITDIQISEELETNAPSIKYTGNEGPKSPQQIEEMIIQQGQEMEQIANQEATDSELITAELDILRDEYLKYVFEMEEQGLQPMSFKQFIEQTMAEGRMSKGPVLPNDPTKPVNPFAPKPTGPVLPDRQMAAYGGIMGLDGRKQYGIGSWLKKKVRKIIPNEVAEIAVKAAPFVAPFNPAVAAAMAGIGGFDQTGRIGSSLKNAAMTYGLGQLGRQVGGAGMQGNPFTQGGAFRGGLEGFKAGFSSPLGTQTGLGKFLNERSLANAANAERAAMTDANVGFGIQDKPGIVETLKTKISDLIPESTLGKIALGGGAVALGTALLGQGPEETVSTIMDRGEGLDIEGIRAEVIEAYKDETGEKLLALRSKYPFLGTRESKNISAMAEGGRIGLNIGGRPLIESAYNLRQRQLAPLGSPGAGSRGHFTQKTRRTDLAGGGYTTGGTGYNKPGYLGGMASRRPMEKGGLMDLGGMEKDYRAEGGFVPIGREEKADDVPARLSVNEFVFTADAVRNAGGGDIDKGAEVMENMMKYLEQGGQVSEESQGMQGAQQMFETSERLSEVI